ncbi:GNAT family N-acetyltransferase [Enteractinococcus fodinae]|uniref:GNAT superfamily N-acetyltransferase n=1 Tax=Enteractinococcus fodinae TaxID=684663 RepID=A0ABU2B0G1_9MICC|nr:GNAT family N-acetyltransferase [Enteractinococcus fodinae]MDR7347102.1 GNAT superfamily N-acetyltransferase [Enteractinococcus fodinae]
MTDPSLSTTGVVREAAPDDVAAILDLIHQLAVYEREPDAVDNTEQLLHQHLFGPNPRVFCHVLDDVVDGQVQVAGIAIWFETYSTWEGVHGIWLEDLFVIPQLRGRGHGKELLVHLAELAVARGYARYECSVLDWNTPAIDFYQSLGAYPMDGWTTYRLDGAALREAAQR